MWPLVQITLTSGFLGTRNISSKLDLFIALILNIILFGCHLFYIFLNLFCPESFVTYVLHLHIAPHAQLFCHACVQRLRGRAIKFSHERSSCNTLVIISDPNFQRRKSITHKKLTMEYTEYSKHHSTKPKIPMISQKS